MEALGIEPRMLCMLSRYSSSTGLYLALPIVSKYFWFCFLQFVWIEMRARVPFHTWLGGYGTAPEPLTLCTLPLCCISLRAFHHCWWIRLFVLQDFPILSFNMSSLFSWWQWDRGPHQIQARLWEGKTAPESWPWLWVVVWPSVRKHVSNLRIQICILICGCLSFVWCWNVFVISYVDVSPSFLFITLSRICFQSLHLFFI